MDKQYDSTFFLKDLPNFEYVVLPECKNKMYMKISQNEEYIILKEVIHQPYECWRHLITPQSKICSFSQECWIAMIEVKLVSSN